MLEFKKKSVPLRIIGSILSNDYSQENERKMLSSIPFRPIPICYVYTKNEKYSLLLCTFIQRKHAA